MPATATREQVVLWMQETGSGYRVAANHFGCKVSDARNWATWGRKRGLLGRLPESQPIEPPKPDADDPDTDEQGPALDLSAADSEEFYATLTRSLGNTMLISASRGHGSAAAQCARQLLAIRAARQAEAAATEPDEDDLTREEFLRELEIAVAGWPEDCFDVVFRVYEDLRKVRVVKVVDGGKS